MSHQVEEASGHSRKYDKPSVLSVLWVWFMIYEGNEGGKRADDAEVALRVHAVSQSETSLHCCLKERGYEEMKNTVWKKRWGTGSSAVLAPRPTSVRVEVCWGRWHAPWQRGMGGWSSWDTALPGAQALSCARWVVGMVTWEDGVKCVHGNWWTHWV